MSIPAITGATQHKRRPHAASAITSAGVTVLLLLPPVPSTKIPQDSPPPADSEMLCASHERHLLAVLIAFCLVTRIAVKKAWTRLMEDINFEIIKDVKKSYVCFEIFSCSHMRHFFIKNSKSWLKQSHEHRHDDWNKFVEYKRSHQTSTVVLYNANTGFWVLGWSNALLKGYFLDFGRANRLWNKNEAQTHVLRKWSPIIWLTSFHFRKFKFLVITRTWQPCRTQGIQRPIPGV